MSAAVKIGLPKGSLQDATFELLKRAGFPLSVNARSYYPDMGDPQYKAILLRPQEMSRYVADGALDAGITGKDWILENESDVHVVCDLVYSKHSMRPVRWVLAVPEDSPIRRPEDLEGKRMSTELVGVVTRWLAAKSIRAAVEFSWGATEVKTPFLVDAIVDVTETGSSLRANKLRIVETILESNTQLIASHQAWKDPQTRIIIENLATLMQGAIVAYSKVGLKMNVRDEDLQAIVNILPALRQPTVSPLAGGQWHAIETVVDESLVREMLPALKRAGAEGIIEYPLNKVIQ